MLGTAYAEAGKFTEAKKYQNQAIDLAPDSNVLSLIERLELYKTGKCFYGENHKSQ